MYRMEQKGRILRVKPGYNPNSSSMGSVIFSLPAAMLGVAMAFGVVSSLILSLSLGRRRDRGEGGR